MTDMANLVLAADSRQMGAAARALRQVEVAAIGAGRASRSFNASSLTLGRTLKTAHNHLVALTHSMLMGGRSIFSLRNAFIALTASLATKEIIQTGDAYLRLNARIKLISKDAEEQRERFSALFDIAQRTRASFEDLGETYVRMANATTKLGLSQRELAQFTENLSKAIQLSGTTTMEAQAGLIQLSQGLASGRLQGDELRSVFENLIGVVKVLEEQTGKTRGELRKLAAEGKLTPELIVKAILGGTESLNRAFAEFPKTVDQALQQIRNQWFKVVGEMNQATGGTQGIAKALDEVRKIIASPEFASGIKTILEGMAGIAAQLGRIISKWDELVIRARHAANEWGVGAPNIGGIGVGESGLFHFRDWMPQWAQDRMLGASPGAIPRAGGQLPSRASAADYEIQQMRERRRIEESITQAARERALIESGPMGNTLSSSFTSGAAFKGSGPAAAEMLGGKAATLDADDIKKLQQRLELQKLGNEALKAELADNEVLARQYQDQATILAATRTLREEGHNTLADQVAAAIQQESDLNRALELRKEIVEGLRTPWEEYERQLERINEAHRLNAITAQEAARAQMAAGGELAGKFADVASTISGNLAAAFEENKAVQIANVVVNTASAMIKALADPKLLFPADLAVAASYAAMGAAQIAAISSAKPGSARGIGSAAAGSTPKAGKIGGGDAQPQRAVFIELKGSSRFSREEVEGLIGQLIDAQKDGARLVMSRT